MSRNKFGVVILPESEVVKFVENHFRYSNNVLVSRHNVGAKKIDNRFIRFGTAGEPDFIGIIAAVHCPSCGAVVAEGVYLAIECKKADGTLRENQRLWLRKYQDYGAITCVARPVPSEFDPTGFKALREQLESLELAICRDCEILPDRQELAERYPPFNLHKRKAAL